MTIECFTVENNDQFTVSYSVLDYQINDAIEKVGISVYLNDKLQTPYDIDQYGRAEYLDEITKYYKA